MIRLLLLGSLTLAGCAPAYEAMPTSPYQWERRQDAQRLDYCRTLRPDTPAYNRDCGSVTRSPS